MVIFDGDGKKIVNAALKAKATGAKAKAKAKATGAKVKAKAIGPEAEAKAKTIKIGLEAPRAGLEDYITVN